ncbi:hypothetical protein [Halorussus halophilus]|uniref:hypothetical protein n=1 Tax=Halorussus halophilus TaxID=2650975 RepID=UPI00130164C1|nr:hypothetical protein [Halorussus halophilus]
MTRDSNFDRRELLKTGTAAGALAISGWTVVGAAGQETTTEAQAEGGAFSFSLQDGDLFRVRFRPRDPAGNPATETVPAACLGTEEDEEYQLVIVRAFRGDRNLGFRGLLIPVERFVPEPTQTETQTTPETTPESERARIALGRWFQVTASEPCDGLNRVTLERTEPPETTAVGTETTTAVAGEETMTEAGTMGNETTTEM